MEKNVMFVIVTIVTLLCVAGFKLFDFGQSLPVSDLASFTVFGSLMWQAWVLYLAWSIALFSSFVPPDERPSIQQKIAQFGVNANMQVLQLLLLGASLVLAAWGWFTGNTVLFVPGVIILLGLLGNGIEQRSLIR
jgi:hypothetical protein